MVKSYICAKLHPPEPKIIKQNEHDTKNTWERYKTPSEKRESARQEDGEEEEYVGEKKKSGFSFKRKDIFPPCTRKYLEWILEVFSL